MTTAETLKEYEVELLGEDDLAYAARACGRERDDGTWEGWLEFEAMGRDDVVWRTGRETTQPNRRAMVYWASGLTPVYLEGALARAIEPPAEVGVEEPAPPAFEGPKDDTTVEVVEAGEPVLDPFSIYASKGEAILRAELGALAAWHLRTIVRSHRILPPGRLAALDKLALTEAIVAAARATLAEASSLRGAQHR